MLEISPHGNAKVEFRAKFQMFLLSTSGIPSWQAWLLAIVWCCWTMELRRGWYCGVKRRGVLHLVISRYLTGNQYPQQEFNLRFNSSISDVIRTYGNVSCPNGAHDVIYGIYSDGNVVYVLGCFLQKIPLFSQHRVHLSSLFVCYTWDDRFFFFIPICSFPQLK